MYVFNIQRTANLYISNFHFFRVGSGPINPFLVPETANLSVLSFPRMPSWLGTQSKMTLFDLLSTRLCFFMENGSDHFLFDIEQNVIICLRIYVYIKHYSTTPYLRYTCSMFKVLLGVIKLLTIQPHRLS